MLPSLLTRHMQCPYNMLFGIGETDKRYSGYHRVAIDLSKYIWTEYLQHRVHSRGFDLAIIEHILRFSRERYFDTVTQRMVVVGRHGHRLVMVPYD